MRNGLAVLAAGLVMVAGALSWLFAGWGLLGAGVAVVVAGFVVDWE